MNMSQLNTIRHGRGISRNFDVPTAQAPSCLVRPWLPIHETTAVVVQSFDSIESNGVTMTTNAIENTTPRS